MIKTDSSDGERRIIRPVINGIQLHFGDAFRLFSRMDPMRDFDHVGCDAIEVTGVRA